MAQATEELRATADAQFWATIAEAGLLAAATVIFTAIAAFAAVIAAKAAQPSVAVARELGVRQLRAYVNLSSARISQLRAGKRPIVDIAVRNTGQTSTIRLRMATQVNVGAKPDVFRYKLQNRRLADISETPIAAGGRIERDIPFTGIIAGDLLSDIRAQLVMVVVIVRIAYVDVFRRRRHTSIKLVLEPDSLRDGIASFRPHHEGNRST